VIDHRDSREDSSNLCRKNIRFLKRYHGLIQKFITIGEWQCAPTNGSGIHGCLEGDLRFIVPDSEFSYFASSRTSMALTSA
jgi:hypothetical protein